MKAITLWQPWATLIAIGAKRYETRSWATNYRGPLAIHAAKRKADPGDWHGPINAALKEAGFGWYGEELPYGCIVCTVELVEVYRTETMYMPFRAAERHFGDYTPGRFAWRLANVQPVANIPARGSQGFWEWQPMREVA
ncbi:MAG: ASCH domain-containing protein [Caldilineaceae bacterium]|nr:ASCH domain-containing protein [Caldilineaceae bacterium]